MSIAIGRSLGFIQTYLDRSTISTIVLGAATIAIHLTLTFKTSGADRQMTSVLFWLTAAYLIWERQNKLELQSDPCRLMSCPGFGMTSICPH